MKKRRCSARLALILSVITWASVIIAILTTTPRSVETELTAFDSGRLPGDDIPATTRCYMTEEEIQDDYENQKIEAALLEKAHVIENCIVTHYDCCAECCGNTDGITASGVRATPYVTVGVDPNIIPLGSDVLVDYGNGEIHYYRADDTGVIGNHIDLCVNSHEEALRLGVCKATVYWMECTWQGQE